MLKIGVTKEIKYDVICLKCAVTFFKYNMNWKYDKIIKADPFEMSQHSFSINFALPQLDQ